VPVGHVPVEQEEAPQLSLAPALNADNCFLEFFAPHFGHLGAGSEKLRARCSKFLPHFPHSYSYIGINSFHVLPALPAGLLFLF